jgi:hypothetical protein
MNLEDQFESAINQLQRDIRQYDEFADWLDKARRSWSNRTDAEQASFLEKIGEFEQYQNKKIPSDQVRQVKDELEEAYKQPLIEAIRSRIEQLLLEIELDLSENQVDRLVSRIVDNTGDDLDRIRKRFDEHLISAEALDETPKNFVRKEIKRDPSILSSPEDELDELLESASGSKDMLRNLSQLLSMYSWVPDHQLPLQESINNYPYRPDSIKDISSKLEYLDEIAEDFSTYGIPLERIYRGQIDEILEGEISEIGSSLTNLTDEVANISQRQSLIESVEQISEFNKFKDEPTEDLIREYRQISQGDYNNIKDLEIELADLSSTYDRWQRHIVEEWETTKSVVQTYCDQFEFDPPDNFEGVDEFSTLLVERTEDALEFLLDLQDWISDRNSELEERLQTETIELLRELIEEGEVWLGDYNIEAIEDVHSSIPIKLTIYDN